MSHQISQNEKRILLKIAREALVNAVQGAPLPGISLDELPEPLRRDGASFVTLTVNGRLRGCIGVLQAFQPLALDVQEHAVAAALQDYRFSQVQPAELSEIAIEISVLTSKERLEYLNPQDLVQKLRPGVDGVVVQAGARRATFLPQVWEQLPDPHQFLSQLCQKMGAAPNLWEKQPLEVFTYQVQEFHE